jgi:hypothetical protein
MNHWSNKMAERDLPTPTGENSCERCGCFEVLEIAGQSLCAECVALAGCGCAEHEPDSGE